MNAPRATALHELTAVQQRDELRNGSISALELAVHYLHRMDRLSHKLGAFVETTAGLALREAAQADRELKRDAQPSRTLLGLPIALKDLQPIAGVRVHNGSAVLPAVTAEEDAASVGLIRAAGAVTLGTTHAPELGIPCYTDSAVVGRPAVTPYDLGRSASGSSGGAAAAVAAGLVPIAHGSDGAGSIRTPAAVCGLVGVKPSRGAVSTAPAASFFGFTADGPLARTVEDAALLLDAMAVRRPRGLHEFAGTTYSSFQSAARYPTTRRLPVAVWKESGFVEVDEESGRAVDAMARLLEDLGHDVAVIPNPTPWDPDLVEAFFDYLGGSVSAVLRDLPLPYIAELADDTRWVKERGDRLTAADFVNSATTLAAFADKFIVGVAPFDLVLTPVAASAAVPLGAFHREGIDSAPYRMLEWSAFTPIQNMSGLPAISLPSHVTADGLPVGVKITGTTRGSEHLLFSVAAQAEEQLRWADRRPTIWSE